eukprot:jgi/Hompol1/4692/HPOL_000035-RA
MDTVMTDAEVDEGALDDTRREVMMIRGGYANVDAYEAELERERERSAIGVEELLIPVQPRKAPAGAPPRAIPVSPVLLLSHVFVEQRDASPLICKSVTDNAQLLCIIHLMVLIVA